MDGRGAGRQADAALLPDEPDDPDAVPEPADEPLAVDELDEDAVPAPVDEPLAVDPDVVLVLDVDPLLVADDFPERESVR